MVYVLIPKIYSLYSYFTYFYSLIGLLPFLDIVFYISKYWLGIIIRIPIEFKDYMWEIIIIIFLKCSM